jgi:putative oxidoreductase
MVLEWNKNFESMGIGLLRISFGLTLVLAPGWPTLNGLLSGGGPNYPDPLGLGGNASMALMAVAEFFCAIFVVLGLFTRVALIPIIIGFFTAFFVFHSGDPFGNKELAFHYLLVFIVLFITGPGRFTVSDLINSFRTKISDKK